MSITAQSALFADAMLGTIVSHNELGREQTRFQGLRVCAKHQPIRMVRDRQISQTVRTDRNWLSKAVPSNPGHRPRILVWPEFSLVCTGDFCLLYSKFVVACICCTATESGPSIPVQVDFILQRMHHTIYAGTPQCMHLSAAARWCTTKSPPPLLTQEATDATVSNSRGGDVSKGGCGFAEMPMRSG
jgi:hypothetical protein